MKIEREYNAIQFLFFVETVTLRNVSMQQMT